MRQIHHTFPSYLCQFLSPCFLRGEKLFFQYYVLCLIMLHSEVFSCFKITSHFPQEFFTTDFHNSVSQIPVYVSHFIPASLERINRYLIGSFPHIISSFSFKFWDSTLEVYTLTFSPLSASIPKIWQPHNSFLCLPKSNYKSKFQGTEKERLKKKHCIY